MSDLSFRHCGECRQPEYACDCDEGFTDDPREERLRQQAVKHGYNDIQLWKALADLRMLYRCDATDTQIDQWIAKGE